MQVRECRIQASEFGKLTEAELQGVLSRARVLCESVDAEVNYTHCEKVREFRELFGSYLKEKATYYRSLAQRYDDAARLFALAAPPAT